MLAGIRDPRWDVCTRHTRNNQSGRAQLPGKRRSITCLPQSTCCMQGPRQAACTTAVPAHTTMNSSLRQSHCHSTYFNNYLLGMVFQSSCWQQMHLTCCLCLGSSSCITSDNAIRSRGSPGSSGSLNHCSRTLVVQSLLTLLCKALSTSTRAEEALHIRVRQLLQDDSSCRTCRPFHATCAWAAARSALR